MEVEKMVHSDSIIIIIIIIIIMIIIIDSIYIVPFRVPKDT